MPIPGSVEMDDTDRKLLILACEDPRMPIQELAKRLGISRQAAHHRTQALAGRGLFKSVRATISNFYLGGVPVAIWGTSFAVPIDGALDDLGKNEFVSRVSVAGGNHMHIFGYLRNISDLSGYVDFVRRTTQMPESTVGLTCYGDGINPMFADAGQPRKDVYKRLSPLDLKIIASLGDDARKPVAEIAAQTGASAKTVRRHIEAMRRDGSLEFEEGWDIPEGEDMVTVIYVNLKKSVDKVDAARRLLRMDPLHFMLLRSFSNLPDILVGLIYSDRMSQVRTILNGIAEDEEVMAVTPNLIYYERAYDDWTIRLPDEYKLKSESSPSPRKRT